MSDAARLVAAAENALSACMALRAGETVLVLTDREILPIGQAFFDAAARLGAEACLMQIPVAAASGAEPPAPAAAAMAAAAVTIAATAKSVTHTAARRAACAAGGRVATMPGITQACMLRCLAADYDRIAEITERLAARLTAARLAHLTCPHGTDLRLPLDGIDGIASTGLIRRPGQGGNLPSGEAYLRPREGGTEGILYVDGSMADVGLLDTPLRLEIREGLAVSITGGGEGQAARLAALLDAHGLAARTVAELGVGTNDRAILTGHVLEDEKVAGTVHVAFGNNVGMGGKVDVPIHLDGVLRRPTLTLDGEAVVADGRLLL